MKKDETTKLIVETAANFLNENPTPNDIKKAVEIATQIFLTVEIKINDASKRFESREALI